MRAKPEDTSFLLNAEEVFYQEGMIEETTT